MDEFNSSRMKKVILTSQMGNKITIEDLEGVRFWFIGTPSTSGSQRVITRPWIVFTGYYGRFVPVVEFQARELRSAFSTQLSLFLGWNSSTGINQAFNYPTLRKKRPTLTFLLEFQQRNQSSFYLANSEKKKATLAFLLEFQHRNKSSFSLPNSEYKRPTLAFPLQFHTGTNQAFNYPTLRKKRPTLTFLLQFQQRNQSSFYLANSEKKKACLLYTSPSPRD